MNAASRLPHDHARGLGACPLVLGECVQGRLPNGRHFLITAPIGLFSWAAFVPDPLDGVLRVEPTVASKSARAARRWLEAEGLPAGGRLRVVTPVRHSQGFGTSTADIVASVRAAAGAWGRMVTPDALARLAAEIEPTDGSMYAECVAFAHREGVLLEALGQLPEFEVLVLMPTGAVDTVAFDLLRRDFRYGADDLARLSAAWDMVRRANQRRDVALLGQATTLSARINERLLPKPAFAEIERYVSSGGAEGVIVAHSGTFMALLFDPARSTHSRRLAAAGRFLDGLNVAPWMRLSSLQRFLPARDPLAGLSAMA